MSFALQSPQWLLLLAPVIALWFLLWRGSRTRWLRLGLLAALVLGLSEPQLRAAGPAARYFLVVDRSASVQGRALARAPALAAELSEAARNDAAGLYVIGFGRGASLLAGPSEDLEALRQLPEQDESDLAAALRAVSAQLQGGERAELVVLSDGVYSGDDPGLEAARLRERGARIHTLDLGELAGADSAITRVVAPQRVASGQRFSLAIDVSSPRAQSARLRLRDLNGQLLADEALQLSAGSQRYALALDASGPGVQSLEASLEVEDDPRPGNNRARSVVEVVGAPRVIAYRRTATPSALSAALESSGLDVELRGPETPLTLPSVQGAVAVVIEDVPLNDLGPGADQALDHYVRQMGGGLLVTGGRNSYAAGGYFRSKLEPLLPVSMDRQEELRRPRIDMAIALDRSGSMAMPVDGGGQKMDLADRGAAEALALLAPGDAVMVLAVDSAAHLVVPLTRLRDDAHKRKLAGDVLTIESAGGGIFVRTALAASIDGLLRGSASTRHIVLFADAADAEEPGDSRELVDRFHQAGGTLSVIGLGAESDKDAALLRELAEHGGGEAYFTADANQLPRVFAQDVMHLARKTFVEQATGVQPGRGALALQLPLDAIPSVAGYNLTFLAPQAELVLVSADGNAAPLAAAWQRGAGKVLAVTFEADGAFSGAIRDWSGYKPFFRGALEWLKRPDQPEELGADVAVEAGMATIQVELPPGATRIPERALLIAPGASEPEPVRLGWVGPNRLAGSVAIRGDGVYQSVLEIPGQLPLALAPVTLPYSPELNLQNRAGSGADSLAQLAAATGGGVYTRPEDLTRDTSSTARVQHALAPYIAATVLLLLLLDIGIRRGLLDPAAARLRAATRLMPRRKPPRASPSPAHEPSPPPDEAPYRLAKKRARRGE